MPEPKETCLALLLDHPGAPSTPHTLPGLPGTYHAETPAPVGGPGELTVEHAKALDADPGCPLKLVTITAAQQTRLRNPTEPEQE